MGMQKDWSIWQWCLERVRMDSFFFNITERRYKVTQLYKGNKGYFNRVDISNGIVFLESRLSKREETITLKNLDRMVMVVMVNSGVLQIDDHIETKSFTVMTSEVVLLCSSRQDMTLTVRKSQNSNIFVLFIADFFLKRYLSGHRNEPIDFLYEKIQKEVSLEKINSAPVDALSLYIVKKLLSVAVEDNMQSIRAEHHVTEFMIHRFSLLDIAREGVDAESLQLASRAKEILLAEFIDPPTLDLLARRCATNASKLKRVFKQVYQMTIYGYIQKLRLEEANLLLRKEMLSIGEIARRVGYRHQGHFSKLFFETYGVHPRELLRRKS
jgi:AraC-like DNA-binding protein